MLQEWGLNNSSADSVVLNYNNCNANDIFADEEEADDGVDYMQTFPCYDNDDDHLNPMFESHTDMSESQMPEDVLFHRTVTQEPSSSRRSHERNVVNSEDDFCIR